MQDLEAGTTADHDDAIAPGQFTAQQGGPNQLVQGIVSAHIFLEREQRTIGIKQRCCVQPPCFLEYALSRAQFIGQLVEGLNAEGWPR